MSERSMPLRAMTFSAAATARSDAVSPSATIRRSRIPVFSKIFSAVQEGYTAARSSLVSVRSGRGCAVPWSPATRIHPRLVEVSQARVRYLRRGEHHLAARFLDEY